MCPANRFGRQFSRLEYQCYFALAHREVFQLILTLLHHQKAAFLLISVGFSMVFKGQQISVLLSQTSSAAGSAGSVSSEEGPELHHAMGSETLGDDG